MRIVETNFSPSIFRIQRKKDFEKVGLGTEQYERPWLRKIVKAMGKKIGIIPISSGLVATHWREKNKGYPKSFVTYHTYDAKREKRFC